MSTNKFYCARIYVTHRCNAACIFCDTHEKKYRDIKDMNWEIAKPLIHQLKDVGCQYIDFTGGEPTLNKNLPAMIDLAKELGIKTEVTTNATAGLTETLLLCAKKARKINISLDTLNRQLYCQIRGVDKLNVVLETIKQVAKIRTESDLGVPKIMTVVTHKNIDDLPKLIDFATKNNLEVYLNPVFSYGARHFSIENISTKLLIYTFKPHVIIPVHFLEFINDLSKNNRPPCRCSATEQILTFAANGQLMMPCYHAAERQLVNWTNLREFLDGDEFQKYAQQRDELASCAKCAVTPYWGISFSFRPDKMFLLQSFADRLEHVKRDLMNKLKHHEQSPKLLRLLEELLIVVRSLPSCQDCPATDCWQLDNMPHQVFDKIYSLKLNQLRLETNSEAIANIPEFMLKLWISYIIRKMNPTYTRDVSDEINWIKNYLATFSVLVKRNCNRED